MPISYTVRPEGALVLSSYSGVVTTDELLSHIRALDSDCRVRPGYRAIADMSAATGARVTVSGLLAVVDEIDRRRGAVAGSTLAVVAPQDLAYGLCRTYAMIGEHQRKSVKVFRTMREAVAWLGLADTEVSLTCCA